MYCKNIWMKIGLIFITFFIGVGSNELFAPSELKNRNYLQMKQSKNSQNIQVLENKSKGISPKPLCKRYGNPEISFKLEQKYKELMNLVENQRNNVQDKHFRQKSDELRRQIKQLEKEMRRLRNDVKNQQNSLIEKDDLTIKLLYVPNCEVY